jgi:DNA repair photolyase
LEREAARLKGEIISLSNSSDPYPRNESEAGLTRECLKVLAKRSCRIQVVTKSTLVARDADILKKACTTVAVTITTDNEDVARVIEPNAPKPTERLKTVENLVSKGIPVSVRIDPIIAFVNENQKELIAALAGLGVKHVTASTYKARRRDWQRVATALPETVEKLKPLYWVQGERAGGCVLLPRDLRFKLLSNVRRLVLQRGMQFAVCREGLSGLNTAVCDGSWLLSRSAR